MLRALGARKRDLRAGLVAEFIVLGALSGLAGASAAALVSYGLSRFLFELPYQGNFMLWVAGVLMAIVLLAHLGTLALGL